MDDVYNLIDLLLGQMKTKTLEAAQQQLQLLLGPEKRDSLLKAVELINKRRSRINNLSYPTTLREPRDQWYVGPRESDDHWPALRKYLLEEKQWSPKTVEAIDKASNKVVGALDVPLRASFSTRGLVLGYVQSGKTANFMSVIAKAADTGFRFFIVLSGLTNSLREQTQQRLTEELINRLNVNWLAWTGEAQDIGDHTFDVAALLDTKKTHLAVVKKNKSRLERLIEMLHGAGDVALRNCPFLIIDDECDQASVNASGQIETQTTINSLLRKLIKLLPRVSYVGYTATPYANVLIDPGYEEDLYPRDFIISLDRPEEYFGAEKLFGRDILDADEVPPDQQGLDMIRIIPKDEIPLLRPKNNKEKDSFVMEVTPTLREAILYYWLASAARSFRGQDDKHSSMLIHSTTYAQSHLNAQAPLKAFVEEMLAYINTAEGERELRTLWHREQSLIDSELVGRKAVTFEDLWPFLQDNVERTEIRIENSKSDERIDFSKKGSRFIIVGGNVLARGLTIEGLISSFFLRTSSQYDSLMQMGRWFGYRPGYEDLPRVWMTEQLADYFRDMATVEAELRNEIEIYAREEITPLDFAPRIRLHPSLAVTAKNKMISAVDCKMSFSDSHIQTRKFKHRNKEWLKSNWEASAELMTLAYKSAKKIEKIRGSVLFESLPFHEIIKFLNNYRVHEAHVDLNPKRIIEYINLQNDRAGGELSRWNVALIGSSDGPTISKALGPIKDHNKVLRSRLKKLTETSDANIKALMTRSDAQIDFSEQKFNPKAKWGDIRKIRTIEKPPLLLVYPIDRISKPARNSSANRVALDAIEDVIGIGLIFPESSVDTPVGYVSAPIDRSRYEEIEFQNEVLDE